MRVIVYSVDEKLTRRQAIVLRRLYNDVSAMSARDIGVRSDVLWRLEERGLVTRNTHQQWRIRPAGRTALDDYTAAQAGRLVAAVRP
jgi:hypothetical protein